MNKTFRSAKDFRMSLEMRLKKLAENQKIDLQRLRRQLAFDRFLSRIFYAHPEDFYLKGGYAMELLFSNARTTRDIDLVNSKKTNADFDNDEIHQKLIEITQINLDDYFLFSISGPKKDLENPVYGGVRFAVDAIMDQRIFVNFRIDVVSDLLYNEPQKIRMPNWLDFMGIEPFEIQVISFEQQVAEKIHAYTLPPTHKNSRVKDLVDLFLIIGKEKEIDAKKLYETMKRVFAIRNTHEIPSTLSKPPGEWILSFEKLRKNSQINEDLITTFETINKFYEHLIKNATTAPSLS